MASEDVIELGSSDDEAEPAPKKSKPMPDAMVCIPRKLHEVTIKPAKLNLAAANKRLGKAVSVTKASPASKGAPTPKLEPTEKGVKPPIGKGVKEPIGKGVKAPIGKGVKAPTGKELSVEKVIPTGTGITVMKVSNMLTNPFANKSKTNGKPTIQKVIMKPHIKLVNKPIAIQKPAHSNVSFTKLKNLPNLGNANTNILKNPIRIQSPTSLTTNLPSGITVKRTIQAGNKKPILFMKTSTLVTNKLNPPQEIEVPTVELDDDEGCSAASGPSWYIRPEEQKQETSTLEEDNNKEPPSPKMIEITIEDSPIKPALNKRTCEVGAELAITIDDSPVKAVVDKNASLSGSDKETSSSKECNSKKKLEYPKEAEDQNRKTLEIEIDIPYEVNIEKDSGNEGLKKDTNLSDNKVPNVDMEISMQKKADSVVLENKTQSISAKSEFHPVYQNFIDACFQLENSEDMAKIVDKKIKGYYKQVPKEYTESEEFIDMVGSKIVSMKASPEKMYLYIKDIVDELNMQRKLAKSQIANNEPKTEEPEPFLYREESEYDTKRKRQIRKLEKTIKKLHRAIQKLEEQEVDFDDEDDSVYLLTERYKERMIRVYAKFCQLTNTKMPSEPRITIDARPGQPSGPAKRLEKWINKKVPIGTPLPFPDFHDVLRCVRDANDEDKLGRNEADIMEEARDLFTRCGKKLQRRRQENEWRLAASRIASDVDPAENNEQLKCKLEENRKVAATKETEIFNKYADRQNQLKLEAVEIGDKEAEESPVESEEEEANDEDGSLENKEKRKERLKRLLHERSKRNSESKETQPKEEPKTETDAQKEVAVEESEVKGKKEDSEEALEPSHNNDKNDKNADYATETLSVSDDSNDLESDIDELHLLQKLHSGNEAQSSTLESSDSDSPIAISDSLESGSDSKKELSDVISIENSSYSESEADKVDESLLSKNAENIEMIPPDNISNNKVVIAVHAGMETEFSNNVVKSVTPNVIDIDSEKVSNKINNDDYNQSVENVLLASSEDENGDSQGSSTPPADGLCINLRDDLISIDETIVGNIASEPKKNIENEKQLRTTPNKEGNAHKSRVVVKNANNLQKDDNRVIKKSNNNESIETSQSEALSASKEDSAQNIIITVSDDTNLTSTVVSMDVDEVEIIHESETKASLEQNLQLTLSLESQ